MMAYTYGYSAVICLVLAIFLSLGSIAHANMHMTVNSPELFNSNETICNDDISPGREPSDKIFPFLTCFPKDCSDYDAGKILDKSVSKFCSSWNFCYVPIEHCTRPIEFVFKECYTFDGEKLAKCRPDVDTAICSAMINYRRPTITRYSSVVIRIVQDLSIREQIRVVFDQQKSVKVKTVKCSADCQFEYARCSGNSTIDYNGPRLDPCECTELDTPGATPVPCKIEPGASAENVDCFSKQFMCGKDGDPIESLVPCKDLTHDDCENGMASQRMCRYTTKDKDKSIIYVQSGTTACPEEEANLVCGYTFMCSPKQYDPKEPPVPKPCDKPGRIELCFDDTFGSYFDITCYRNKVSFDEDILKCGTIDELNAIKDIPIKAVKGEQERRACKKHFTFCPTEDDPLRKCACDLEGAYSDTGLEAECVMRFLNRIRSTQPSQCDEGARFKCTPFDLCDIYDDFNSPNKTPLDQEPDEVIQTISNKVLVEKYECTDIRASRSESEPQCQAFTRTLDFFYLGFPHPYDYTFIPRVFVPADAESDTALIKRETHTFEQEESCGAAWMCTGDDGVRSPCQEEPCDHCGLVDLRDGKISCQFAADAPALEGESAVCNPGHTIPCPCQVTCGEDGPCDTHPGWSPVSQCATPVTRSVRCVAKSGRTLDCPEEYGEEYPTASFSAGDYSKVCVATRIVYMCTSDSQSTPVECDSTDDKSFPPEEERVCGQPYTRVVTPYIDGVPLSDLPDLARLNGKRAGLSDAEIDQHIAMLEAIAPGGGADGDADDESGADGTDGESDHDPKTSITDSCEGIYVFPHGTSPDAIESTDVEQYKCVDDASDDGDTTIDGEGNVSGNSCDDTGYSHCLGCKGVALTNTDQKRTRDIYCRDFDGEFTKIDSKTPTCNGEPLDSRYTFTRDCDAGTVDCMPVFFCGGVDTSDEDIIAIDSRMSHYCGVDDVEIGFGAECYERDGGEVPPPPTPPEPTRTVTTVTTTPAEPLADCIKDGENRRKVVCVLTQGDDAHTPIPEGWDTTHLATACNDVLKGVEGTDLPATTRHCSTCPPDCVADPAHPECPPDCVADPAHPECKEEPAESSNSATTPSYTHTAQQHVVVWSVTMAMMVMIAFLTMVVV